MKAYQKYMNGQECGLRLKALYLEHTHVSESSDAQNLGKYFEYCATGSYGREELPPEPVRLKSGELAIDYKRAEMQGNLFKEFCKGLGITIIRTNVTTQLHHLVGTLDIIADWNGQQVVIDLKYSGLIDNKWDEMGWEIETLGDKEFHMVQARQYSAITGMPFYFWVWSPTQIMVNKLIHVNIEPESLVKHSEQAKSIIQAINMDLRTSFKARPELMRCAKCELFQTCDKRALLPEVEEVYHSI